MMLKRHSKKSQVAACFVHKCDDQEESRQFPFIRGLNEYGVSTKSEVWDKYVSEWGGVNPRRFRVEKKLQLTDLIQSIGIDFGGQDLGADKEPEDRNLLTQKTFKELAERWCQETKYTSSAHDLVLHPAYQRIIGLGPDVIPFVLEELRDNGGHWFWALQSLTGDNPVSEVDVGRYKKMRDAWLTWGVNNSYI